MTSQFELTENCRWAMWAAQGRGLVVAAERRGSHVTRYGRSRGRHEGDHVSRLARKALRDLAELLVRLGSFGLDLTWRVEFDEIVDPRCVEMERQSAGAGMDTLTLLSLTTPFLQLIDAEARGFAEDELMVVLTEFDSSLWDVRAVDERVLSELRRHCPGATDL
ncbi:hypothetical protein ACFC0D_02090 [Streptomyces sp. NPDC056222]|uniref:hypothetical protein n=1 Tax=Streptomyces sp. NPDC056222 TaxID=3345749 RepID=UPI0035D5CDF5